MWCAQSFSRCAHVFNNAEQSLLVRWDLLKRTGHTRRLIRLLGRWGQRDPNTMCEGVLGVSGSCAPLGALAPRCKELSMSEVWEGGG